MARDRREYYKQWRAKNKSKVKTYNETVRKKWQPLRKELERLYKDMGRYEEFKPAFDRQAVVRDLLRAKKAGVLGLGTPEEVAQFQIDKIKAINAQRSKITMKNVSVMGLLYSLAQSDWESDIKMVNNRGNEEIKKHLVIEHDGEFYGLAGGKIKRLKKTKIEKPEVEPIDTGRYYDDPDYYDDYDTQEEWDTPEIDWSDGAEGDDWEFEIEGDDEVWIENTP